MRKLNEKIWILYKFCEFNNPSLPSLTEIPQILTFSTEILKISIKLKNNGQVLATPNSYFAEDNAQ